MNHLRFMAALVVVCGCVDEPQRAPQAAKRQNVGEADVRRAEIEAIAIRHMAKQMSVAPDQLRAEAKGRAGNWEVMVWTATGHCFVTVSESGEVIGVSPGL
jgi:hypothetical protein